MPEPSRPRVLLAVEPRVLEGALSAWLVSAGVDDVVARGDRAMDDLGGHYDAAVVTITLPDSLDADVVIELPDAGGNSGQARVVHGGDAESVEITSASEIIGLLDVHCPGGTSRLGRGDGAAAGVPGGQTTWPGEPSSRTTS